MNYYKKYTPYLFLLPAAAVMIVFFFIPFFQTFGLSFFDYSSSLYNPNFVGADNYIKLFKEPVFYKVMFNTFMYLVIAVPFLVTFPLFLVIVSIVVAAIAFKWLYAGQGILNYILSLFHIKSIGWLVDTKWALFSVALVTIWKGIGYYMMIYLASLMSVPQDLYEACDIDGANFITTFDCYYSAHNADNCACIYYKYNFRDESFCRNLCYDKGRTFEFYKDNCLLYL